MRGHQHRTSAPRGFRPRYGEAHQRASAALIAEHVARWGWTCSGDGELHPVHASTDLVADHADGGYRVVCRSWNSARRNHGLG